MVLKEVYRFLREVVLLLSFEEAWPLSTGFHPPSESIFQAYFALGAYVCPSLFDHFGALGSDSNCVIPGLRSAKDDSESYNLSRNASSATGV